MVLLCDAQVLLWFASGSPRLSLEARTLIVEAGEVSFSVVSPWEVVIKRARHRSDFPYEAPVLRTTLLANDFGEVVVRMRTSLRRPTSHRFTATRWTAGSWPRPAAKASHC